jgi:hypothetical protein
MKWLAIKAGANFQVDESKEGLTSSFFIVQIFSPLPNVVALTLNTTETVCIISELCFRSEMNLVKLHAFVVEKMDDDSLVILHR